MSDNSKIEWTDASWTPIRARNLKTGKVGWHCEHATTGCEFCYAEGMNKRLGTGLPFKPGHRKDIEIFLDEQMLTAPLRWREPRMVFVCSMTDLFADFVPDTFLDRLFAVMARCQRHTFQILTKRPERMREYCDKWGKQADIFEEATKSGYLTVPWPLPNVWLGVSCERQEEADERIPLLLQTPAAVRFISAEPLLGPIDLKRLAAPRAIRGRSYDEYLDALHGERCSVDTGCMVKDDEPSLDWVIVGGESGSGARDFNIEWARQILAHCRESGVACFIKQLGSNPGEWRVTPDGTEIMRRGIRLKDRKGGDWSEWPKDLRVREFPVIDSSALQRGLPSAEAASS